MVKSWLKQLLKYWMLLLCLFVPYIGVQAIEDSNILYSNKPAVNWHEAFPLGNGRMGRWYMEESLPSVFRRTRIRSGQEVLDYYRRREA